MKFLVSNTGSTGSNFIPINWFAFFPLLDWDPSEYPLLQKTILSVEKFKTLWHLALNFHEKYEKWYYGPFKGLETGIIQKDVEQMYSTAVTSIKTFHDTPQARRIAETVRAKVEKFRTYLPILHTLCNPGKCIFCFKVLPKF